MVYDNTGRFMIKSTNSLGHFSEWEFDPVTGNLMQAKDINGQCSQFEYDGFGNLTKTTAPDGTISEVSKKWEINGSVPGAMYSVLATGDGTPASRSFFDYQSREIRVETSTVNGTVITEREYNTDGQLIAKKMPCYEGDPLTTISYDYKSDGRLESETINGNLTTQYDYSGLTTTVTTPSGMVYSKTSNANGNLVKSSDLTGDITYEYHSSGQLRNVLYNGSNITIGYDDFGRKESNDDPNIEPVGYSYNAFGEIATETDGRGKMFSFTFDELGRTEDITCPDGSSGYQYYESGDGLGRIQNVSSPYNTAKSFQYDRFGRLTSSTEDIEGQSYPKTYTYDEQGNVATQIYPSGFELKMTYTDDGVLDEVRRTDNNELIWQLGSYDATGRLTAYTSGNGLETTLDYDEYGYPESIVTGTLQEMKYVFDPLTGTLDSRQDLIHNETESFQYDDLDRLTECRVNQNLLQDVVYDDNGNISFKTDAGDYTYHNEKVHAVSQIDNNPVTIPSFDQDITYNSFNKVESIVNDNGTKEVWFTYDHKEQRKSMKVYENGELVFTKFYAGLYEKEISDGLVREIHYIAGGNGIAAVYIIENGIGNMYYVLKDYLGSVTALTDANGNIVEEYNYDAWGRRRNVADWSDYNITNPELLTRGFTGHEHMDDFGIINMNGRLYDPILGRMLSPDNYVQMPDYTQNLNRYSYALNNPFKYTDPDGNNPLAVAAVIGGVLGSYQGYQIAQSKGYTFGDPEMSGYMLGGGLVGSSAGLAGAYVGSLNIVGAQTASLVVNSTMYSGGMNVLSGGESDFYTSFGAVSYNWSQGELGHLGKSGNTFGENLGYGLGAISNFNDVMAGLPKNRGDATLVINHKDLEGHASIVITDENGYERVISVGPMERDKYIEFVKGVEGKNTWTDYYSREEEWWVTTIELKNVNYRRLIKYANRLNTLEQNNQLLFQWPFSVCSNYAGRALTVSGHFTVFNPSPYTLGLQGLAYQYSVYSYAHLLQY